GSQTPFKRIWCYNETHLFPPLFSSAKSITHFSPFRRFITLSPTSHQVKIGGDTREAHRDLFVDKKRPPCIQGKGVRCDSQFNATRRTRSSCFLSHRLMQHTHMLQAPPDDNADGRRKDNFQHACRNERDDSG